MVKKLLILIFMKKKKTKAQLEEERQEAERKQALAAKENLLKEFSKKIYLQEITDEDIRNLEQILTVEDYNDLRGTYNDLIFNGFPYSKDLREILYQFLDRVFQAELIDGGLVINMLSYGYISEETFKLLHHNTEAIRRSGFYMGLYPMLKRMLESGVKSSPHHEVDKIPLSEHEKENFRILIKDFSPEMQLTLEEMAIAAGEL